MKGYEMSNEYNSKINQTGVVRSAYALGFKSIFYFVSVPASTPVLAAGEKLHGTCVDKCACKLGRKLPSVWRYISFMEYGLLMGYEGDHGIGISMEYQRNYSTLYVCSLRCH